MSGTYSVTWGDVTRSAWDRALADTCAAYQQDWAYGDVMVRLGTRIQRAGLYDPSGQLCGVAQFVLRRVGLIGTFALCSYGPVWLKPMQDTEQTLALHTLRRALKLRWPRLVAVTPDSELRPKGFKRVMTSDATIRLDLTQEADALRRAMDGKWRNRLVSAEKSDLQFSSSGTKPGQYQWLIDQELAQRKKRGYRGLPPAVVTAWQEEKARARQADRKAGVQVFRADLGKEAAGAMLFLTHGKMATYHIGWSSDDGRHLGAHNLILWNAMLALKEKGFHQIDLGGVNTGSGAGIARFKLGTGGTVLQRSGTFV